MAIPLKASVCLFKSKVAHLFLVTVKVVAGRENEPLPAIEKAP